MHKRLYRRAEREKAEIHERMKRGFDGWVSSLPSMPPLQKKAEPDNREKELAVQGSDHTNHSSVEERWQDDGGKASVC